jgi:4-hydroxy-3-polyprenylbenzoate decarboxylase
MKIVVAITAASGSVYASLLLRQLVESEQVERVALIWSANARAVALHEGVEMPCHEKIVEYDNDDMFSAPASGSADWNAMVVIPSSVGTVGRVASGVSQTLIERAADVMLKERRRLLFVVRESPYSLIHLRNMTTLTEAGAIIMPASPSFYMQAADIESLCRTISLRAVEMLGLRVEHASWGERAERE